MPDARPTQERVSNPATSNGRSPRVMRLPLPVDGRLPSSEAAEGAGGGVRYGANATSTPPPGSAAADADTVSVPLITAAVWIVQ